MHLVPVGLQSLRQFVDDPVDPDPHEPVARDLFEQFAVVTFASTDHRRQQLHARAIGEFLDRIDDLVRALLLHRSAAFPAELRARTGEEQAEIVVDLGDRADRRPGVVAHRLLLDRDGRTEPLDVVHIRPFHDIQELACVGREALHEPALPFGVDRIEGKTGFAGAGQTGDDDELVPRDVDIDTLQVMLACAADHDRIVCAIVDGVGHTGMRVDLHEK